MKKIQEPSCKEKKDFIKYVQDNCKKLEDEGNTYFYCKTKDEAAAIAQALAKHFPNSENAELGISELLFNAIEHGNLEIGMERKSGLISDNLFNEEIINRLAKDEYSHRSAQLLVTKYPDKIEAKIKDDGAGFNWRPYLTIDERRLSLPHGRGIAIANMLCFDELIYNESGNEVVARVIIK